MSLQERLDAANTEKQALLEKHHAIIQERDDVVKRGLELEQQMIENQGAIKALTAALADVKAHDA